MWRVWICQQRPIRASVIYTYMYVWIHMYTLTKRRGRYKLSHFYSTCSSKFNISLTSRKDKARILSIQQFKYILLNYLFHQPTVIKGHVCSVRISNLWFHFFFYSDDKTILTFRHMAQSVHNCFDFTVTVCALFSLWCEIQIFWIILCCSRLLSWNYW